MCSLRQNDASSSVKQFIKQEIKLEEIEGDFIKAEIKSEDDAQSGSNCDDYTPCFNSVHSFDSAKMKVECVFESETLQEGSGAKITTDNSDDVALSESNYTLYIEGDVWSHKTHSFLQIQNCKSSAYICGICSYPAASKFKLNLHNRMHTGEKPYKCDICSYTAARKDALVRHIMQHTGEKPYKCNECSYTAADKRNLVVHKRTHTGEKPYKCDECSYTTADKRNLVVHKRTHTGEKAYKCDVCSFAAVRKFSLDLHIRTHTGEKPYKCDECSYAAANKRNLVVHQRTHTGEKPYKCDECFYAAAIKRYLVIHKRTHTDHNNKCDVCSYAAATKRSLAQHTKVHTVRKDNLAKPTIIHQRQGKPFKCDLAPSAADSCSKLTKKFQVTSMEIPHNKFNLCSYTAVEVCDINKHAKMHHVEIFGNAEKETVTCDECLFSTPWKSDLIAHKRTHLRAI